MEWLTGLVLALSTVPALMYVAIERGLLGENTPILGSR